MLKFLGNGSCFNVKSGNTAAYYLSKDKKRLFLIDCGESVFEKIVPKMEGVQKVIVVITHFHSDHIGSLPSFIFYCNIVLGIKPIVVFPVDTIKDVLLYMGVDENYYVYKNTCKIIDTQVKVEHKENMDSYAYVLKLGSKKVYYSGDSTKIPEVILLRFVNRDIDIMYHDMTRYTNSAHAHVTYIASVIPKKLRKYVFGMHFDDKETKIMALKHGFKIALRG